MEAIGNILVLMAVIFSVFAILGCYIYPDIGYEQYKDSFDVVNEFYNFDNFYFSFILVIKVATGESWPIVMLEFSRVNPQLIDPGVSLVFFILLTFCCTVILLNLFVLVILQKYDEFKGKEDNPIERFNEIAFYMKKTWNKFSSIEDEGTRINMLMIAEFLLNLEGELVPNLEDKSKIRDERVLYKRVKKQIISYKFTV